MCGYTCRICHQVSSGRARLIGFIGQQKAKEALQRSVLVSIGQRAATAAAGVSNSLSADKSWSRVSSQTTITHSDGLRLTSAGWTAEGAWPEHSWSGHWGGGGLVSGQRTGQAIHLALFSGRAIHQRACDQVTTSGAGHRHRALPGPDRHRQTTGWSAAGNKSPALVSDFARPLSPVDPLEASVRCGFVSSPSPAVTVRPSSTWRPVVVRGGRSTSSCAGGATHRCCGVASRDVTSA